MAKPLKSGVAVRALKSMFMMGVAMASGLLPAALTLHNLEGGGQALEVAGTSFTAEEQAALKGNTVAELWKTGTSLLKAQEIAGFTGAIRIKGGVYEMTEPKSWGNVSAIVHVESGASLHVPVLVVNNKNWEGEADKVVHVIGDGYGEYAAIVKGSQKMSIVMDGDASFAFLSNWCSVGSKLDMNGYTFTQRCATWANRSECVWPSSANVKNHGHIVIDGVGKKTATGRSIALTFLYSSDHLEGADHTLTLRNGLIDWYSATKRTNWTLILEADASIGYGSSNADATKKVYSWDGDIQLKNGSTLSLKPDAGTPVVIGGNISGDGNVAHSGVSASCVSFLKGENTYTGKTKVDKGVLVFMGKKTMASQSADRFDLNGRLAVVLAGGAIADGFTPEEALALYGTDALGAIVNSTKNGLYLCATNGVKLELVRDADDAGVTTPLGVYTNALAGLTGEISFRGTYSNGAVLKTYTYAPIVLTADPGTVHDVGAVTNIQGTVVLDDFGTFYANLEHPVEIASERDNTHTDNPSLVPRLVLKGGTSVKSDAAQSVSGSIVIANNYASCGVLEIHEGVVVSNNIKYFANQGSYGALYQHGGIFNWSPSGNAQDVYVGNTGSAYVGLAGGEMSTRNWVHCGAQGTAASCVIDIKGGAFTAGAPELHLGWMGTGVVYQTGGTLVTAGKPTSSRRWLRINTNNYCKDGGGFGLLAVADEALASIRHDGILMAERTNGVAHVALLDGGTLETPLVCRAVESGQQNNPDGPVPILKMPFPELCNGAYPSYVHFNGGTLRALTDTPAAAVNILGVRSETEDSRPTDVIVYAKGAILDASNFTVSVHAPLRAPGGNGIAAIELPDSFRQAKCLGAPVVTIVGDGKGATAVVDFDMQTGTLQGIRVTSPGENYTHAVAYLSKAGSSATTGALACTLAPNTSGPLVKRGTGTLVLKAANTYGGRTVLAGGVLKLDAEGALPEGTSIELAGGALDANGYAVPCAWYLDYGRVVESQAAIACPGNLAFPPNATLTVENFDEADLETRESSFVLLDVAGSVSGAPKLEGVDHPHWKLVWRGSKLYMGLSRGTVLMLR